MSAASSEAALESTVAGYGAGSAGYVGEDGVGGYYECETVDYAVVESGCSDAATEAAGAYYDVGDV